MDRHELKYIIQKWIPNVSWQCYEKAETDWAETWTECGHFTIRILGKKDKWRTTVFDNTDKEWAYQKEDSSLNEAVDNLRKFVNTLLELFNKMKSTLECLEKFK